VCIAQALIRILINYMHRESLRITTVINIIKKAYIIQVRYKFLRVHFVRYLANFHFKRTLKIISMQLPGQVGLISSRSLT
jgi:hypothetical protein